MFLHKKHMQFKVVYFQTNLKELYKKIQYFILLNTVFNLKNNFLLNKDLKNCTFKNLEKI